jgi:transcriptional regulator with XRE-family HTH domain
MIEDVGTALRAAREAAGLSLAQMARLTRYGKSYLGNVETGRRRATRDVVLAYGRALGCVSWIMGRLTCRVSLAAR